MKLKIGDKITCISDYENGITIGKTYDIIYLYLETELSNTVIFRDDNGLRRYRSAEKYRLVQNKITNWKEEMER